MPRRAASNRKNIPDLYIIQRGSGIKLGVAKDVEKRHNTFQTASPDPVYVIGVIPDGGYELESLLHDRWDWLNIKQENVGREWFRPHPALLWWVFIEGLKRNQLWLPRLNLIFMGNVLWTALLYSVMPRYGSE